MGRPYYSRIAKAWHAATGSTGGPLKKYLLNDILIERIGSIHGRSVLEVGAGTGYFARLLNRRRSGEVPSKFVVTDQCGALLRIAEVSFRVAEVEYRTLDLRRPFPFEDGEFDVVVASMVLNELGPGDLARGLREIRRVLKPQGRLVATVVHPLFVQRLRDEGQLSRLGPSLWTMPGKGTLRLPVVPRSEQAYLEAFSDAGLSVSTQAVAASDQVVRERAGLRHAAGLPLAWVLEGERT